MVKFNDQYLFKPPENLNESMDSFFNRLENYIPYPYKRGSNLLVEVEKDTEEFNNAIKQFIATVGAVVTIYHLYRIQNDHMFARYYNLTW